MTLTIRERRENGWATVKLVQAILTGDVRSTMIHGQTGQEISDGWLDAGSTVFVHPRDVGHTTHPYTDADELPDAHDVVYDAAGMKHRIRHADWDAIHIR